MCEYCDNGETEIYNDRAVSRNDYQTYTGFEVWIENNNLNILSCFDSSITRPMLRETKFPINFCPMCGRLLNDGYDLNKTYLYGRRLVDLGERVCCETCYYHNNDTDQCSNEDSLYDFTLKLFRCNKWSTLGTKTET